MNRREFLKAGTTLALAPAILPRAQSPQVIDMTEGSGFYMLGRATCPTRSAPARFRGARLE